MNRGRRKLSSGIGGRTGKNVLLNKNIRKLPDGLDNFADYFTDSSDASTNTSVSQSSVLKSPNVSLYKNCSENIPGTNSSPIKTKSPRKVIGSRSNKNILPQKIIKKLADGTDDFNDYFTDSDSNEISNSPENSSPLQSPRVSTKSKNYSKNTPAVTLSSPITRLSSSKVIHNAEIQNGSNSEEVGAPLISNTFTKKIKKSKGSAKKSIHEKHDSCDAKLLKLAKDYEKSEILSNYDSQLHATEKTESNISKISQKNVSRSPNKKKVSNVGSEKRQHLTRSCNNTPTKAQSENTENLLIKTADKNISLNKHYHEKNISKIYDSNTFRSELHGGKSQQSHFDLNTSQNSDVPYEVNPVAEQDNSLFGNKNLSIKRKLNLTPKTVSKKKNNTFVCSKNVQASKDLLNNDLNDTFQVVDPPCLPSSNEENLNDFDSELHDKEKSNSKSSETLEISPKTGSRSPKEKVSFDSPEDQHHLTRSRFKTSVENQSGNMDDTLARITDKNVPTKKKIYAPNTSESNELQSDKSVSGEGHVDINTTQDSEESSEEDGVAEQESTSYRYKDAARKYPVKRKSSHTRVTANKKQTSSFVESAKKRMPEDKRKEKLLSPKNNKNLNETYKNVQPVNGSPRKNLDATFQVDNFQLSSSSSEENLRETNKKKASYQVSAKGHKNKDGTAVAGLRKSGRTKIAPLERWRNERPRYRIENGLNHFIEIDPGCKKDDGSSKAIAAKQAARIKKQNASKKAAPPPKFKLNDLILQKKVTLPLLRKFSHIPWEEELNENSPYHIKRVVQTPNSNFGFIEIKAGKSKPLQYLPSEDIYLCAVQGKVKAFIQDKEITVEEKDTLVVPRSVPYTLKNIGQKRALLVFSVGRYKYLETLMHQK